MIYTSMTIKAMKLAYKAHEGQVDRSGVPYIFHPIHLAEQMDEEISCTVALLHDVVGYTAMRLLAIIEVGGDLSRAANMRLFGAVFLLPLFYYFGAKLFKRNTAVVMDISAVCLTIGLIFGRFDCLVGGCCAGMRFPIGSLHWPLREIELIYYVAFLLYYCTRIHHGKTHGEVYPIFMITYGILRFLLEWFRVEYTTSIGALHLAHIWALICFMLGLSVYETLKEKRQKQGGKNRE